METEKKDSTKRRKGGRPPKRIKRNRDLRVRVTDTERFLIAAKAKQAGVRISEYVRQAAKRAKVVPRHSREDLKIHHTLAGIANNLNQITKLAHEEGLFTVQKRCREILAEVDKSIKDLNDNDRESDDR
ncbi:plasmid mobilization protein [Hufsiella ginkgonis]|uniref:Plasmid mobilization relaxosome protein MobC n=1 Tax=Hufsiella ginkgonis TaxID=2695274 RepID=A0A7K1XSM3_9SPHI|nr:plasmid mobilization relaxosome protein MobC [Hufsiella ginkgonis]MXV14013.1 plasmid mobilization relaxosome protein MobC [Hufsiella ginkgonis]